MFPLFFSFLFLKQIGLDKVIANSLCQNHKSLSKMILSASLDPSLQDHVQMEQTRINKDQIV